MLILDSTVTGCVSISALFSLACVPARVTSSAVGLKICAITARTKKCKSGVRKEKKKHDEIALLGKAKLDIIEVLISKSLIDSYIIHDEFFSVNNALRKYKKMKEEIKNPETST